MEGATRIELVCSVVGAEIKELVVVVLLLIGVLMIWSILTALAPSKHTIVKL